MLTQADVYFHGRLSLVYEELPIPQGMTASIRIDPFLNRQPFASLAPSTVLRLVIRDKSGTTVLTKEKADASVDSPNQGSVTYDLLATDTDGLAPGTYSFALRMELADNSKYEWRLPNPIRVSRSATY